MIFYENPQFYFLMNDDSIGEDGKTLFPLVYPRFARAEDRKAATEVVFSEAQRYIDAAENESTDVDKVRKVHDMLTTEVEYNNSIVNEKGLMKEIG